MPAWPRCNLLQRTFNSHSSLHSGRQGRSGGSLSHGIKILLPHDLATADPEQADFVELEALAGWRMGHVVLKSYNETIVVGPRTGDVRGMYLMVGGPPFAFGF